MNKNIQIDIERDERISRYLKGQMTVEEEKSFLEDMKSDMQLKQDAIAQARLVKAMAQVDSELIQELKNSTETEIKTSLRPNKIIYIKLIKSFSIAASVAILLFTGYKGYEYYSTTRLGMEYATVFPMGTVIRGGEESIVVDELRTLFDNVVERKDLSSTTKRLSELWEISNQATYNDYTDYAPYIGWYLAIGYLENYEKEKARDILEQLNCQFRDREYLILEIHNIIDHL